MLKGHAKLELARNGVVVQRVEQDNNITPWFSDAINKGNINFIMSPEKALPLKQWFNGCLLTDKDNDPLTSMIAQDSTVIAQASNNAYTGTNIRRGSFNTNESGNVPGGYRYVWDWSTSQGNGEIKSVCLTRPALGATDITEDFSAPDADCLEYISDRWQRGSSMPGNIILDYEREKAFTVYYDGTSGAEKIIIKEYYINTFRYHLTGAWGDAISLINTHEISQAIAGFNYRLVSVSYTGDYFYVFKVTENSNTLDEYKITIANWTCVKTTHTYNGAHFSAHQNYDNYLCKDIIPVIDGYAYAFAYHNLKIYKLNLSNDADIVEYTNPLASVTDSYNYNGPGCLLPNGDWYKFSCNYNSNQPCVYHHNGKFYRARGNIIAGNDWGEGVPNLNGNEYGTVITTSTSDDYTNGKNWQLSAIYPYVSTIANLQSKVTKTFDLTMKLTYTLAEAQN
jgi:hypothetical protein